MKISFRAAAAVVACLVATPAALAQNAGTVTNHAFALGKGAGNTGYTSLLCTSAQLAVGQAAADPICQTITGDVTISAAGVTAIGAAKVTNAMLGADVFSTAHTWSAAQSFTSTINKLTFTPPATGATVSFADGSTFNTTGAFTTTLNSTGATLSTLPSGTHTLAGLDVPQTWNALQLYVDNDFSLAGATSGSLVLRAPAVAGASVVRLPAGSTDFSATGGPSNVVKQVAAGAPFTVAQLGFPDISGSVAAAQMPALTGDVTTAAGTVSTTIAANAVTNAKSAQMAAATLKGNPTNALASPSDFTIQGLVARGAPDANNDKIPLFDNASGTIKYVTPGQVASTGAAGVSSIAGNTGAFTLNSASGLGNVANDIKIIKVPVANGGTGATGLVGLYGGLQPLKLDAQTIAVNPGSFADSGGTAVYSTTAVLTTNLSSAVIGNSVASATVAASGSGGTAGTQTVTASGGVGTAAVFSVTVTAGGITAVNSITNAGNYTTFPTNPVSVTGAGLTGATLNLTANSQLTGGMLSPGGLSTSGPSNDGVDVQLYLVKRNSDGALALVGDNANVYGGNLAAVISNGSNSFSTGGPPTSFWNGTKVRLTSTGTFPTGFAAGTDYYTVAETNGQLSTTFGLSATLGGAAITAGSTYTGGLAVRFGVQDHLDAAFGANVWSVLRRVHFAFRWKWQWGTGVGGIPDFTADPRGDTVWLTNGNDPVWQVLPSTNSAAFASLDLSPWLSNLNRIAMVRGVITSTGTAGTAAVKPPGISSNGQFLGEGPISGMTAMYGTAAVQTDSTGAIQWQATGGSKLQLFLTGWVFVDPS